LVVDGENQTPTIPLEERSMMLSYTTERLRFDANGDTLVADLSNRSTAPTSQRRWWW